MELEYLIYRKARHTTAEHYVTVSSDDTAHEATARIVGDNPDEFPDGTLVVVVSPNDESEPPTTWVFRVSTPAPVLLTEYEV